MVGIPAYSTTPASNVNANTGITWDEGMSPGLVNNSARQNMADTRAAFNDLIWFQYGTGDTSTLSTSVVYSSGTAFKVKGVDVTTPYHAGRRVKAVGSSTGTIYGTISSNSFSTDTTVNVSWDSGSLSNETLTIYLAQIPVTGKPVPPNALALNRYTSFAGFAPSSTTGTTAKQMGLGSSWVLIPAFSGRVRIRVTGWGTNGGAANTHINGSYGTSSAPANGAAKTGTALTSTDLLITGASGSPAVGFAYEAEASGLTIGTQYWFDLTLFTSNGSFGASVNVVGVIIEEF